MANLAKRGTLGSLAAAAVGLLAFMGDTWLDHRKSLQAQAQKTEKMAPAVNACLRELDQLHRHQVDVRQFYDFRLNLLEKRLDGLDRMVVVGPPAPPPTLRGRLEAVGRRLETASRHAAPPKLARPQLEQLIIK